MTKFYSGKVCSVHPELKGKRYTSSHHCVKCNHNYTDKSKQQKAGRTSYERLKLEVFTKYGGKCEYCGVSDFDILTIDHALQNGAEHRRAQAISGGNRMYYWLRSNGYPEGLRLLCYNCNIKAFRIYQREQRRIKHGSS